MARVRGTRNAFGAPGLEPRWSFGDKDGVGTAYSADSRIWFTVANGILTEVFYPTIDKPQLRDLQLLITDGMSFFHDELRSLTTETERLTEHALGFIVKNTDPEGRYEIDKRVIAHPHLPVVLQRIDFRSHQTSGDPLRLFVLAAPHLNVGGSSNDGFVIEVAGREILAAEKDGTWLAIAATAPFRRLSCGYVGASDGWTDLAGNFEMNWDFDLALNGNVALTGEIDLAAGASFTLALALGDGLSNAVSNLLQSLGVPFEEHEERYKLQWDRICRGLLPLEKACEDGGNLYHGSYSLLLAHEDKTYPGAFIASMSIPWGQAHGDDDMGGYHLVWTRDMVNSALGTLAAGDTETPLRALIYLAASQQPDGGFGQNFWINGEPYWRGIQLDEVAFPIILARHLDRADALRDFDPYPLVRQAAAYLIRNGPATEQERWEEASGYSPSTLAASIAGLICAAAFARERGQAADAAFMEEYADFLESHIERWTMTTEGSLLPDVPRHYIRIHPVLVGDAEPDEDPNRGQLGLANQPHGDRWQYPAKEIVDAGFLELVRYGIRRPDAPVIIDSLTVADAVLKVDTPFGPCWRRYNHDGYGQRRDGGPYIGSGRGRAWPLLTGERGHYALAAGQEVKPYLNALESFASKTGLLPEQVWDEPDRPDYHMCLGRPTGSAMPLMWAHAEYIKLLRSAVDGVIFDTIPEVAERYLSRKRRRNKELEIWKPNRHPASVASGGTLRVQAPAPFLLHWSRDHWQSREDTAARATGLSIHYVDIQAPKAAAFPITFTMYWEDDGRWEGRDYTVVVEAKPRPSASA